MTISEALTRLDLSSPNRFTRGEKVRWLSMLDGLIYAELLRTHQDAPEAFTPYDDDTPDDTRLLAPFPYDQELYRSWLESRIHLENGEAERFSVSAALFNAAFGRLVDAVNRTRLPVRRVEAFRL